MLKKLISVVLAIMLAVSMVSVAVVNVSAEVDSENRYYPSAGAETSRYYFYMPSDWYNEFAHTAGVYWWQGTDACTTWPGYNARMSNVENVYYCDVPQDVTTIIWNNGFDGGDDDSSYEYSKAFQTVGINTDYYDAGESDLYPNGINNFDNMIYVIDPDKVDISALSGKTLYGGEWYYYYGNGEYGVQPTRADAVSAGALYNTEYQPPKNGEVEPTNPEFVKIYGDINIDLLSYGSGNYSKTINLDAGSYKFKVNDNGTTKCFGFAFDNTISGVVYSANYSSYTTLNTTGGYYTFTYNVNTDKLSVNHRPYSTEPTTVDPTTPTNGGFVINATSNFFPSESINSSYNDLTGELTVTYLFSCEKDILDTQWTLTYDTDIFSLSDKNTLQTICPEMADSSFGNIDRPGEINFFASELRLYDYSTKTIFAQVIFDVNDLSDKYPFTTNIDLNIEVLRVSAVNKSDQITDSDEEVALVLDGSTIEDVSLSMTKNTIINCENKPIPTDPIPTEPTKDELTVNATSNFFTSQTTIYDKRTKKLVVTYYIQSEKDLLNTQWEMTYDSDVLSVSKDINTKDTICPSFAENSYISINDGIIKFNTYNLSLFDISSEEKIFVRVVFDVNDFEALAIYDTTIDLNVINLTVSALDSSTLMTDENEEIKIVYRGNYDDLNGLIVSERIEIINYEIPEYIGDVDNSGIIDIHDATMVAKHLVELTTMTEEQLLVADCDGDGIVSVKDVTCIQLYLADASNYGNTGNVYNKF